MTKVFLLLISIAVSAAEGSAVLQTEVSPKGSFVVEHHTGANTKHEIWLVSASGQARHLLFKPDESEADYDATILVAPDERWIARNQTYGSTRAEVALHTRKAPLLYGQAGRLEKSAWQYAARALQIPPAMVRPFHRTVEAVKWLDASTLLLLLRGDSPGGFRLGDWHCVYDVKSQTYSVPKGYLKANRAAFRESSLGPARPPP